MALDPTKPLDTVPIKDLPSYIRETREYIEDRWVNNVSFESGVSDNEPVYYDTATGTWKQSLDGDANRGFFHGFADVTNSRVVLYGTIENDTWDWTATSTIYVSDSVQGGLTEVDTGLPVGVAVTATEILIDTQLNVGVSDIVAEITAARGGEVDLDTRLDNIESDVATNESDLDVVEAEIIAGRGGEVNLDTRFDNIETEITAARGGESDLDTRLDGIDDEISAIDTILPALTGHANKVALVKDDESGFECIALTAGDGIAIAADGVTISTDVDYLPLTGGTLTGNLTLDDGVTNSPYLQWVGGTNDDTISLRLIEGGSVNTSVLEMILCDNGGNSQFRIDSADGTEVFKVTSAGDLTITGALSKGSGTFKIPHPLDETKHLYHGFIEGPRYDLIYRGTVVLVDGQAEVNIDTVSGMTAGTFEALTQNAEVLGLHNKDSFDRVRGEISGATLIIYCEDETSTDEINWAIIAERADTHILALDITDENGCLIPEQDKEE